MSVLPALPPMNPVLSRELKQRMRGRHIWIVLSLYLVILALILRWVYVAASRDSIFDGGGNIIGSAGIGRAIFQWLLFFMLMLVCFIVPGMTAAAISGERERQTLISLQITLLRPRSIVLGKLLASLAFVVLLIVASLPLVTIPFLVGGVSMSEVLKGLLMVVATAVVLACVSLACSAVLRRTQGATVLSYAVTAALVLGTLIVYGAQQIPREQGSLRPRPWILAMNPFVATADVVQGRNPDEGFESPFMPLMDLLRLSDEDRLRGIMVDDGRGFAPGFGPGAFSSAEGFATDAVIAVPGSEVVVRPAPAQVPAPVPPTSAVGRPDIPILAPPPMQIGPDVGFAGQEPERERVRLAGVPFWLLSLASWVVLGLGALALAVRRISLPAAREAR